MDGPRRRFGEEFPRVTGIDLLARPFDREAGFTVLRCGHDPVLAFRRDVVVHDANRSDDKPYRALYQEFRARFRVPPDLAAEVYADPYVRHFYDDAEIAAFTARWTRTAG